MNCSTTLKKDILAFCHDHRLTLTALREQILDIVLAEHGVIKAYGVLAKMQGTSARKIAPPTVYRALDFWAKAGVLHKVDAVNGYVVCRHRHGSTHGDIPLILVCRTCNTISESDSPAITHLLSQECATHHFQYDREAVVITGLCDRCAQYTTKPS